jgi:enoyl-CoA hydratase
MISVKTAGDLVRITIDRPEKANSLTAQMLEDLCRAVGDANKSAKVMVLTGTGKVFSAGADLDAARAGLATSDLWEKLSGAIATSPCLTIAALNGTVAGGAFGMVLACDIRVAVAQAKFFYPVMKLGYLPQPSDPARLSTLVGPARAKMILMAGQKIAASDALNWGLVDRLVDGEALNDVVNDLGRDALAADRSHIAGIKGLF